jgi:hypothetical protein
MDGRIGGPPVNGCHAAPGARFDVAGASRDRVTIDLRGIGDAVRGAALMLNASVLGLSYGEYVARLVHGSCVPQPLAERQADRAALLSSNDRLAALSTDLVALVTLLRQAKVEQARPYRDRLETADAEIRRHLDRASAPIDRL